MGGSLSGDARRAYDAGDYEAAIKLPEQASAMDPSRAPVYGQRIRRAAETEMTARKARHLMDRYCRGFGPYSRHVSLTEAERRGQSALLGKPLRPLD